MGEGVSTIGMGSRQERGSERLQSLSQNIAYIPKKERERQEIIENMKTMPKPQFGFTNEKETTMSGQELRKGTEIKLPDGSRIDISEDGGGGYYVRNIHPEKGQVQKRTIFYSERMAVAAQKREYNETMAKLKKKYSL